MPIYDQGYQHWHGTLSSQAGRFLPIIRHGASVQLKNRWVRWALFAAWNPVVVLMCILALWGLFEQQSRLLTPFLMFFENLPEALKAGPRGYRTPLWTLAFRQFFEIQLYISMFMVLLVGPDLISQDLRFNAIPLYLSRPVRRFEYFVGKLGVIAAYLAAVTIVPVILLFLLGYAFSLDPTVVRDTGRLFLASVAFGAIVVVSAGLLMLAFSSLSRNSRYVGAMWIIFWTVSQLTSTVLGATIRADWCPVVSYTNNLLRIRDALFDAETAWNQVTSLSDSGRQQLGRVAGIGPFGGSRRIRQRLFSPAPPPSSATGEAQRDRSNRSRQPRSPFAPPTYPWEWSAGVLGALAGLSVAVLMTRIRSLDRLR
jgi:ABC-2 type transport system permease protein